MFHSPLGNESAAFAMGVDFRLEWFFLYEDGAMKLPNALHWTASWFLRDAQRRDDQGPPRKRAVARLNPSTKPGASVPATAPCAPAGKGADHPGLARPRRGRPDRAEPRGPQGDQAPEERHA